MGEHSNKVVIDMPPIQPAQVKKWIGKTIYAAKKDGTVVTGKLVRVSGTKLYLKPVASSGKAVRTKALAPLVLFDLLAIGTSPYAYGGFYGGFPGYGPFGGVPYGYGYPGFFW